MTHTLSRIISYIGHPLLVLTYALLLLLVLDPFAFGVRQLTDQRAILLLFSVFGSSALIPGFGIALLRPLGFMQPSADVPGQQERIAPYIIAGIFYLWLFRNLYGSGQTPPLYVKFVLGATIGLFVAFFINIFNKISAHAVGMGSLTGMLTLSLWHWPGHVLAVPFGGGALEISQNAALAFGVVLAGMVGTARLALGAHTLSGLYRGYVVGFVSLLLANWLI